MKKGVIIRVMLGVFAAVAIGVGPRKPAAADQSGQAWRLTIKGLDPTIFFPRQPAGQPLKQAGHSAHQQPGLADEWDALAIITVGNHAALRGRTGYDWRRRVGHPHLTYWILPNRLK